MWREPPAWTPEKLPASRSEFLNAYRKKAALTPTVPAKFSNRAKPRADITSEMFDNWWHARNRPAEAELRVILGMFGHLDQKAEQEIWDAWNAGNLKAKGRSNDRGRASAVPGDGVPRRFEARPVSVPRTPSPIVDLTVGLTADDPTRLGHDELAVTVSLNWGFDDEQNVNCRLRLTEYHLFNTEEHCAPVGEMFGAKATVIEGVSVERDGRRWIFRPTDGKALRGKFGGNAPFYHVKRNTSGLPQVILNGRCPGKEYIHVEWLKPVPEAEGLKHAVIAQFLKKCMAEEESAIETGKAGAELTEVSS